ncbi:Hypothetical protein, putative [Bodo saltans]|uniref:Uncharacterized protein n=1 Tax=Bodo saltans TaxID=75058 RepID=A0A0S4JHE8_BODSA|nr:Hypothetical protein, putative [Bodo saltans]|eukprot:CUG90907.1 Hypothetical protein, putative [Bodo saltans]
MLSSDSVLQCAPMLQDILDSVASSANPNTTPVVVAPVVSSSGKGAATTSTQSSSLSCTAALVSSILNYVHATCSGSTPVAPTDLQALTAPINTSSLRPLALMMTPSLILSLLEAQHYEMLGTVLSNNNDKSSDATIISNNTALRNLLLVRIYSSMRNAMQRNQSILYPENLPGGARSPNTTTNPANTTSPATTSASPAGSASGRVGGNSSNQQQDNDCGPAAAAANIRAARNRHDATYLSRAALRGQVMSAAVYQVPNYSGDVTFENVSVIAYTALCGFVYVWHNISTTRDMSYLSSARVLAKSAMTLLNDTRYWNLARGDSALCCVNTAMLHLASMSLGPSSGQTGSANDPTNHPSAC